MMCSSVGPNHVYLQVVNHDIFPLSSQYTAFRNEKENREKNLQYTSGNLPCAVRAGGANYQKGPALLAAALSSQKSQRGEEGKPVRAQRRTRRELASLVCAVIRRAAAESRQEVAVLASARQGSLILRRCGPGFFFLVSGGQPWFCR
jgi:hypothetical protein